MAVSIPRRDSDASKGASETPQDSQPNHSDNNTRPDIHGNLADQISHRESDLAIRDFIDAGGSLIWSRWISQRVTASRCSPIAS